MDIQKIERMLILEEGKRNKAYQDSRGIWTIGIGHNLEADGFSPEEARLQVWTDDQISTQLEKDIREALEGIDLKLPWTNSLDDNRHAVIVGMAFQLGLDGLLKFKNTLRAVQEGRWQLAHDNMLQSRWASQAPKRVARLADIMLTGEWSDYYK